MAIRTYYCGQLGFVKTWDHVSGSWDDVSIPGAGNNKQLFDIMTFPSNPSKVITVGDGGNNGQLWLSLNTGSTWVDKDNGTLGSYAYYEVWITDANTVFVCGIKPNSQPILVRSIDGGNNFSEVILPPGLTGAATAIHFPTPFLGVIAIGNRILYTIDGGSTWIPTNGGAPIQLLNETGVPLTSARIPGIHIKEDTLGNKTITALCDQGVVQSIDSGATYITRYYYGVLNNITLSNYRIGEHLTWYDDNTFWATDLKGGLTYSIDGGVSWGVSLLPTDANVFNIKGAHFYEKQPNGSTTRYTGYLGTNLIDGSNSIIGHVYSDIPLAAPPIQVAPSAPQSGDAPGFVNVTAVWTEVEPSGTCVRLRECNATREIIVQNVAGVAGSTAQFLSDLPVGSYTTLVYTLPISPCTLLDNQIPPICWEVVEIIEECDIEFPPGQICIDVTP